MVNNVTLLGRITRDPEVKAVGEGSAVCNFTLAVNRNFKNAQGEYEADFINVVAFGNTAQRMQQYVAKGNLLAVTGRIQTRNYENNMGQRVYVTEVVANNVSFVESRKTAQTTQVDPAAYADAPEAKVAATEAPTEAPAQAPAATEAPAPVETQAPVEAPVQATEINEADLPF